MSNSGSAYFKHLQAEHLNTITISATSYHLKESESGSIIFVDYKANNVAINLPRLAASPNGRKEDAGINFKFIFNTNDGSTSTNIVTINSIDDSLSAATIISSNNSSSLVSSITYNNITNGQCVEYVSDGTYWTASQSNVNRQKIISTLANGTTLTLGQSGATILQSTDSATITLPATVAGIEYTFIWVGANTETFNISPNANDKIGGSIVDVANGNVVTASNNGAGTDDKDLQLDSGSRVGDRVTLVADGSVGWFIKDGLGSWAFEA